MAGPDEGTGDLFVNIARSLSDRTLDLIVAHARSRETASELETAAAIERMRRASTPDRMAGAAARGFPPGR